jgi:hypothetical protein
MISLRTCNRRRSVDRVYISASFPEARAGGALRLRAKVGNPEPTLVYRCALGLSDACTGRS